MEFIGNPYERNESVFDFDFPASEENCTFEPLQPFDEFHHEAFEQSQRSGDLSDEFICSDDSRYTVAEPVEPAWSLSQPAEEYTQCNSTQVDIFSTCWVELFSFKKTIQNARERQLAQLMQKKRINYFPKTAQQTLRKWYLTDSNQYEAR